MTLPRSLPLTLSLAHSFSLSLPPFPSLPQAKDGALALEDMTGGTFTISNGGVFGSLFGTPIINIPQSAILGMHATKMRLVLTWILDFYFIWHFSVSWIMWEICMQNSDIYVHFSLSLTPTYTYANTYSPSPTLSLTLPPSLSHSHRAVVVDGQVVARPMMYLALTYDHRLVDGREAVTFLKSVQSKIEDPARLLLNL